MIRSILQVLWLFVPAYAANMVPVLVRGHLEWLATPMDGGRMLGGKRLLGDHKTWRGLLAGVVMGGVVYELQRLLFEWGVGRDLALMDYGGRPVVPGLLMGLGTGVGDAVKSFFKRRVGIAPGASWPVFDQLDFFAGACLFVAVVAVPPLAPTLACLPIVLLGSVVVTTVAWALGLKEAWV